VTITGPSVGFQNPIQWPILLAANFLKLKREVLRSNIVLLRIPMLFSCLAYHLVRSNQIVTSLQVTDPQISIPLILPKLKFMAGLLANYCKRIASRSDKAFFVSDALREIYGDEDCGDLVCNESRLTKDMIIDTPCFDPHRPARVVYVGRLMPEKGVDTLLRAIAEVVKKMPIELWIVGNGPIKSELELLAKNAGITNSIKWLGYLKWGKELFERIRQCDTLVLPSHTEALGLVTIEGMSQGLVIIGTSVGGIPEILGHGDSGILIPPRDHRKLAEAIEDSILDTKLRKRLITKGLKQAERNCIDNGAGKMAQAISTLIEKNIK